MHRLQLYRKADFFDPTTCQWLRFRRYRGRRLRAFLPDGKIVFADRQSEIIPDKPGYYFAALVDTGPTYAFAKIKRAHRSLKFPRSEAFGSTQDGVSFLLSFHRSRRKRIPFVCDPNEERLAIFGYDTFRCERADGYWAYYEFRHGEWRRLNWYGPCKMSDEDFAAASKRVAEFEKTKFYGYGPSAGTIWSDARRAGVVTAEEVDEAHRRTGPSWHYSGD